MQEFTFKQLEDRSVDLIAYKGDEADIVIPEKYYGHTVTMIDDSIFKGHTEITSVKIPETIQFMGGFVFDGCVNLRHIVLPASLEYIWQYGFVRSAIEEIVLPEKLRSIAPFTFKDCKNLRKVVCNAGLKDIGSWAFEGCTALTDITYGTDTVVSQQAFEAKILNS